MRLMWLFAIMILLTGWTTSTNESLPPPLFAYSKKAVSKNQYQIIITSDNAENARELTKQKANELEKQLGYSSYSMDEISISEKMLSPGHPIQINNAQPIPRYTTSIAQAQHMQIQETQELIALEESMPILRYTVITKITFHKK